MTAFTPAELQRIGELLQVAQRELLLTADKHALDWPTSGIVQTLRQHASFAADMRDRIARQSA